jgi:putative IMPACT (imprinted ancient) family translation regulator
MAPTLEKNIEFAVTMEYDYSIMNEVMQVLKQADATIYKQDMQLFCILQAGIPLVNKDIALQKLKEIRGLEIK